MKAKLIKDHDEYMLINDERLVIATTDASMLEVTDKMKLSKQNCDEIFGVVDVEKLANDNAYGITFLEFDKRDKTMQHKYYSEGFEDGFNKALELIDKLNQTK